MCGRSVGGRAKGDLGGTGRRALAESWAGRWLRAGPRGEKTRPRRAASGPAGRWRSHLQGQGAREEAWVLSLGDLGDFQEETHFRKLGVNGSRSQRRGRCWKYEFGREGK